MKKTKWKIVRNIYDDLKEARSFVEFHDVGITLEEFDELEAEYELPEIDAKKLMIDHLRKMWREAVKQKRNIWRENDEMRREGMSYEERQKRLENKRQLISQAINRIEARAKRWKEGKCRYLPSPGAKLSNDLLEIKINSTC